jgi:pyruvate dehydrogenase E2 component (dihydrolipoamide acetyltransferase)
MEVGRVVEWLKQDGDQVEAGEFLFLVETEKAVTEVEALDSGTLRIPPDAPAVGDDVEVGGMLAWIVPAGEAVPFAADAPGGVPETPIVAAASAAPVDLDQATLAAAEPETASAGVELERIVQPAISPRARRAADALGVDWTVLVGSGSGGRIVERDVLGRAG